MKAPIRPCILVLASFAGAAAAEGTRADLDGVWLFYGAQVPEDPGLTPAGQQKLEQYDPLRDDTDTICNTAITAGVYNVPGGRLTIGLVCKGYALQPRAAVEYVTDILASGSALSGLLLDGQARMYLGSLIADEQLRENGLAGKLGQVLDAVSRK